MKRAVAVAGSAALGLCLSWLILEGRGIAPVVELLDNSVSLGELLERRAVSETIEDPPGMVSPRRLRREPIDEETAKILFAELDRGNGVVFDPHCYFRRAGGLEYRRRFPEHPEGGWTVRTNSLGMREDGEVLEEQPGVRVLVTGDSHTDGLCANADSFANRLEVLLSQEWPEETVEVLNAGTGGYMLYNYLGVYETYRWLKPDVFVVALYGGNDFSPAVTMRRYFHRLPPPSFEPYNGPRLSAASGNHHGLVPQELAQVAHYINNPADEAATIETSASIFQEIARLCAEDGTRLVLVYLPPISRGQPRYFEGAVRKAVSSLQIDPRHLAISDRLADALLSFLEGRGIETIDLRPSLRRAPELCYWKTDSHLNLAGHRLAAEALFELLRSR